MAKHIYIYRKSFKEYHVRIVGDQIDYAVPGHFRSRIAAVDFCWENHGDAVQIRSVCDDLTGYQAKLMALLGDVPEQFQEIVLDAALAQTTDDSTQDDYLGCVQQTVAKFMKAFQTTTHIDSSETP